MGQEIVERGGKSVTTDARVAGAKRVRSIEGLYEVRRRISGLLMNVDELTPTSRYAFQQAIVVAERELLKRGQKPDPVGTHKPARIQLAKLKEGD